MVAKRTYRPEGQGTCQATGKVILTMAGADLLARDQRHDDHDKQITSYRCKDCNGWHTGHRGRRDAGKKRKVKAAQTPWDQRRKAQRNQQKKRRPR